MPDRGPNHKDAPNVGSRPHRDEKPRDVGRTMGGGSLGHAPPDDVSDQADLRNNPPDASSDAERLLRNRPDRERNATGSEEDPVMPADDATQKTKI